MLTDLLITVCWISDAGDFLSQNLVGDYLLDLRRE